MKRFRISLIAMSVVCVTSLVWACSVPVFRYALERWANDHYEVVVFHKGTLTEEHQVLVDDLTEDGAAGEQHANVHLTLVDLDDPKHPDLVKLCEEQKSDTLPWMMVKYPLITRKPNNVWSGELSKDHIARLLDSPSRHEIARRLLKGDTAVWVLLETGRKADDDAAFKILKAHLFLAEQELKLPEIDEADIAQGLVSVDETGLKLQFSTVRISREDSQEEMFTEMLLGSEDDLRDFDEPMAFPVFGRGRVLYALIGKGINPDTIRQTCQELIGPCTCQVKEENPGVDIVTSVDWENLVQPFVEIDRELPPLPGFGGIVSASDDEQQTDEDASAEVASPQATNSTSPPMAGSASTSGMSSLLRNILISSAVGVVAVLLMSFFVMSRKEN